MMSMKSLRYYPELNALTGSVNATIVLLQLEYWFAKNNNSSFYKFLDACTHPLYQAGDSWVEELGFTKHEFRSAFAKIGKAYTSKKAMRLSQDLFEGHYYASYYDRKKGLTYYIRNNAMLDELFSPETKEPNPQKTQNDASTNPQSESPLSVDYNKKLTSENNTYTHTEPETVPYDTIKALFNQYCPSYPQLTVLTPKRKALLKKLWYTLGQTLESFKKVFSLAEKSDFLSGRLGAWRASFDWLIQEDKFIALLEGVYLNPNRQSYPSCPSIAVPAARSKFNNIYSHNWDFEELEKLEAQYITRQLERRQLQKPKDSSLLTAPHSMAVE